MRILLSGGGTGGHIFPNIAIVEEAFKQAKHKYQFLYIGEKGGIEEKIILNHAIPFHGIHCGKLRRYFSVQNVTDLFKIPLGIAEACKAIRDFNPDIIFLKGGFVSVPVVIAGFIIGKKIITHDSDAIPALSTKINARFAKKVCLGYFEAQKFFNKEKVVVTGIPIIEKNLSGNPQNIFRKTKFSSTLPIVLVLGGSLGAQTINQALQKSLPELLKKMQTIHFTGFGKKIAMNLPGSLQSRYYQLEFAPEMGDFYSCASAAISRAGAGAIAELRTWGIPTLLIPLSKKASHGDQLQNAKILFSQGKCLVLEEKDLNPPTLTEKVSQLLLHPQKLTLKEDFHRFAAQKILKVIDNL